MNYELSQSQLNALQTAHDHVLVRTRTRRFVSGAYRMTEIMALRLEFFGVVQIDETQKPARIAVTENGRKVVQDIRRIQSRGFQKREARR